MNVPVDKNKKQKIAIIGMCGGKDSTVVAYLLKRQGFRCIGVGINFFSRKYEDLGKYIMPEFNILKMESVKHICDSLDIEFYATNAAIEFEYEVLDRIVAGRLSGELVPYRPVMTELIFRILIAKAEIFKADYVATGHYVRIIKDRTLGTMSVYQNHDTENDESDLLSRLKPDQLENLMCPLSDLRKEDVENLAMKLGFKYRQPLALPLGEDQGPEDFKVEFINNVLSDLIPKSYKRPGVLTDVKHNTQLGEHQGIYQYEVGQGRIQSSFQFQSIDKDAEIVRISPTENKVYVGKLADFRGDHAFLSYFSGTEGRDITKPLECLVRTPKSAQMIPAKLCYKNNKSVNIFFKEEMDCIVLGEIVIIYTTSEAGAKLVGSGFVKKFGKNFVLDRGREGEEGSDDHDSSYTLNKMYF